VQVIPEVKVRRSPDDDDDDSAKSTDESTSRGRCCAEETLETPIPIVNRERKFRANRRSTSSDRHRRLALAILSPSLHPSLRGLDREMQE